jgi:hypothetical protein
MHTEPVRRDPHWGEGQTAHRPGRPGNLILVSTAGLLSYIPHETGSHCASSRHAHDFLIATPSPNKNNNNNINNRPHDPNPKTRK